MDNIYLKGGSNMAEALYKKDAPISIAERMKRNRDAVFKKVMQQDEDR